MSGPGCDRCRELAPELALGIAEGAERAAALEHLAGCPGCRREVAELAGTADALLLLAPAVEPPTGFEGRALAGFDEAPPRRTSSASPQPRGAGSRWRWAVPAVAAALLLAGVGVVVAGRAADRSSTSTAEGPAGTRSAPLRDPTGAVVGRVQVVSGARARLSVELLDAAPDGRYAVRCDYESGPAHQAGVLAAGAGRDEPWTTAVHVPVYDLRRVRLVSADGGPNLEAELPG